VSLKQLLRNVWLYNWILIVPLAVLASFTDLLLLGGIHLFLSIISDSISFNWLKNIGILHWTILMFALIAARYLFITLRVRSEERLGHKLESHLRIWWIRTVKNLHPSQFHKQGTDNILHNANLSVSAIPKGCKLVTQSIQAISQLLFFVPVLFLLSWQLTIVLLFVFAPIVLYLQMTFKNAIEGTDSYNQLSGEYDSNLWRWAAIRKFWNNKKELSKYLSLLFDKIRCLRDASINMGVKDATVMQNIETLSILIMCIVLAVCAGLIKMGAMEPFQIILFCTALIICYKPLKDCSQLFSNLKDLKIAYVGLHDMEYMEKSEKFFEERNEESIKIENIAFRYRDDDPWVFQSLSNTIRLNRPVILQGLNGSGKTTLLRILSGLEIPKDGKVFMPLQAEGGSFYFSQRLFLPPVSWLEEIIIQKEWSPTIRKFFEVLDLENLLKKNGHSNGELQKVGFAWAVVSGAHFLFLDEPFSFIAQDLQESIFQAFWNATTETGQWWMMASHHTPPQVYQNRVIYWKL
jgi:ABC-type bacteriocin/lantibiotic exporter with double-glycine peptidase domain